MLRDFRRTKPALSELANMGGAWRMHPRYRGCVGHWLMHEGAGGSLYDISGHGNTGTLSNMDPATDWVQGQFGPTLDFDGTNDVVDIPKRPWLDMTSYFTVSAWFRPATETGTIAGMRDGETVQWHIYLSASGRFNVRAQAAIWTSSGAVYSVNTWQHACVVFGAVGTAPAGYMNGTAIAGPATALTPVSLAINLSIGCRWQVYPTPAYPLQGQIDDLRIFDRAFTEAEAQTLFTDPFLEFQEFNMRQASREMWFVPEGVTTSPAQTIYQHLVAS